MKNLVFLTVFILGITVISSAQSIGVRAGLNYSLFSGPLEKGETYKTSSGIHFGISYGFKFSNQFMIRTELAYNQVGSKHSFNGDSYYQIYTPKKTVFEKGKRILDIDITNSYIALPITAVWQPHRKIELFGGLAPQFLISPTGRGQVKFTSDKNPTRTFFRQTIDARYYGDDPKAKPQNDFSGGLIYIYVDEDIVTLPKNIGGYYQEDALYGTKYNWFNLSAIGGLNYFLNKGLYIGGRVDYGLLDITNNKMDYSMEKLNDDLTSIRRKDKDIQISYQISLGFKF